jgi:phage terminase large subunit-like protein
VRELWCVVGRRAGKSRMAAALAVFQALFQRHKLAKGETGHVLVLAATQDQARTVFAYAVGFIEASEALRREVRSIRLAKGPAQARSGVRFAFWGAEERGRAT